MTISEGSSLPPPCGFCSLEACIAHQQNIPTEVFIHCHPFVTAKSDQFTNVLWGKSRDDQISSLTEAKADCLLNPTESTVC